MDRGAWRATPWGHKESDTTEQLTLSGTARDWSPGWALDRVKLMEGPTRTNAREGGEGPQLLSPVVLKIYPPPLQPDVFPGNCWAFEGDQGQVVIRLPGRVQLSDITLQHPPPTVAHTRGANSAPRDFAVYVSGAEAKEVGDFPTEHKAGMKTGATESLLAHP